MFSVARNKGIDHLRRRKTSQLVLDKLRAEELRYEQTADGLVEQSLESDLDDDLLRLIFTCCHPSLSKQVRVSLTLKTLCGLTTQQVANAYVVSEETMAQRLVRAKKKIKSAGIPYQIPPAHLLDERLSAVLSVIYFIFNEGYRASIGEELINSEFCDNYGRYRLSSE